MKNARKKRSTTAQAIWNCSAPEQKVAMRELEKRGFEFLVHFGNGNAIHRLESMDEAFRQGRLYEHLRDSLGVLTTSL